MNYYEILQVSPNAELEVIQAAYRRLSMKYHPDRNYASAECEQQMRALNVAYEILSDPVRREEYDRTLRRSSPRQEKVVFTCPHCHNTVSRASGSDGEICVCPACHGKVCLRQKRHQQQEKTTAQSVDKRRTNPVHDDQVEPEAGSCFTEQTLKELRKKQKAILGAGKRVGYIGISTEFVLLPLSLIFPFGSFPQCLSLGLFFLGFPIVFVARYLVRRAVRDKMSPVQLNYRLTNRTSDEYLRLIRALSGLSNSNVWTITRSAKGGHVRSSRVTFRKRMPPLLECNLTPVCLVVDGDKHWFLPDCVLTFERGDYYASKLGKVTVGIEHTTVYEGEQKAGYRWRYSRIDGGPDRRYRANWQIPLYRSVFNTYCSLVLNLGSYDMRLIADRGSEDHAFSSLPAQYERYCELLARESQHRTF